MKNLFVLFSIIVLPIHFVNAQNYQWAKNIGSNSDDYGNSIAVDVSGNCYITGCFQGTADFDPGAGTALLTPVGSMDIFFAKYDANGNYLWAKNIGNGSGYSIALDSTGNCYITGWFSGIADFDPGAGTALLTSIGNADIFIAKYDANGNYIWAKSIGSTDNDIGNSIVVDGRGNCYITGYFQGTADFDPGAGTALLTSIGGADIFFAKYDSNGNYFWAKNIGSTSSEEGYSIALDGLGNCYISGYFSDTTDFDPGIGTAILIPVGCVDIFFAKYDANGNYLWAKNISTASTNYSNRIAIDSIGNCYITGNFGDTTDFDPGVGTALLTPVGSMDIFFAKYNASGNYLWAKNIGGVIDHGYSIALDSANNCYITGRFQGTADFDPGAGTALLTSVDYSPDIFFAKYDASGNYLWAKDIGSINNDMGACIALDGMENCYITGYFNGTADFDPNAGTALLTPVGMKDIFFAKYSQTVGITENIISESINIYPNPTTDNLIIETPEKATFEILNIQGQLIKRIEVSSNKTNVDVSTLTSGMYFVKAKMKNGFAVKKIIKQ
jgi:hypothetical protein